MTKINIAGLNKEEVILALFENVYRKSNESKGAYDFIIERYSPNEPGQYTSPSYDEIKKLLRHTKGHIDYLGCVKLSINFTDDVINTYYYDKIHKTGIDGIKSASAIIEKLKSKTNSHSFNTTLTTLNEVRLFNNSKKCTYVEKTETNNHAIAKFPEDPKRITIQSKL